MEIFEEMGNDDAVRTALDARRQETCSANWQLSAADDTPQSQEILEFVEDNIYPVLDDLLRWLAGGALQYGFGAIEPVYQWSDRAAVTSLQRGKLKRATKSGQRRIYVRRMAHIVQKHVQTFKISPEGEFQTLIQYVYNGVSFRRVEVPGDKLLMWTYNRLGDDYFGTPPTRQCYKAWTFKSQLERLNLLSFDRFGVGIPVAEESEGGFSPLERQTMAKAMAAFRSGDSNYIVHPYGGKVSILSGDGRMTMTALEWVRYYTLAVAKVFLTQQTELGSTETGARAVSETFYEQLGSIVQADCEELGAQINNVLIVPLVNFNFGPQAAYPSFTPSQRVKTGSGVATAIAALITAGVLHPRPEDEAYFRDVFELPAVEVHTLQTEQLQRVASAAAIAKAAAAAKPKFGDPPANNAPSDREQLAALRELAAGDVPTGAPAPAEWGKTSYRTPDYSAWEHGILRPDSLLQELYLQHGRVAGEVQDVLRAIDANLTSQIETLAGQGAAALSAGVRTIAVPNPLRTQLRNVLLAAAVRARAFGSLAVRNELERQLAPSGIGPQRSPVTYPSDYGVDVGASMRMLAATDNMQGPDDLHLNAEVDRAVENEIDRREQSARSGALTALAQAAGATAAVLTTVASTATKAGLVGLSTGVTQSNVQGVVNVGFGIGRSEQAREIAAGSGGSGRSGITGPDGNPIELTSKVYSAVMDSGTCPECAKWDGAEFPLDYPEDFTGVQAPNPRCEGTYAKCRCVWIYVTNRESAPLVPASKGPLPIRRAA